MPKPARIPDVLAAVDLGSNSFHMVVGRHAHGQITIVDPMSAQYLIGAEIDYREGLDGAQFVIRNPNAKTTCGCGSSFSA